jgi:heme-degrading monooxygenase HmoA
MEFQKDKIESFLKLFEEKKAKIRAFPGCEYLELLQGTEAKNNVFMTYSYWRSADDLDNYRYSDLFKETWSETKKMFAQKPEAISFIKKHSLD